MSSAADNRQFKLLNDFLPIKENYAFVEEDLLRIEQHFHNLILNRAKAVVDELEEYRKNHPDYTLPRITNNLATITEPAYFAIPGFYGGFAYILLEENDQPVLLTDSWSRVVGGSGQRHEISVNGARLIAEGFV